MHVQFIAAALSISVAGAAELKFRGGYPVVEAMVNGQGPFRMVVETGSQSTVLRPAVLEKLGMTPVGRVEVVSTGMSGVAAIYRAESVEVDGVAVQGVEVMGIDPPLDGVDGFLGQSFLAHTDYLLDYAKKKLILDPDEDGVAGVGLPLVQVDGRPAVRVNGRTWLLDSGASHVILFRRRAEARSVGTARMATVHGERSVEWVYVERLQIGPIVLRGVDAAVVPAVDERLDGLLPVRLLRSVYVNNRKQYLLLEPRSCGPSASVRGRRRQHTGE